MEASVGRFMEDDESGEESEMRPLSSSCTAAGKNGAVQNVSVGLAKDSSGREIFVVADLPETDLKENSWANFLGEIPSASDCHLLTDYFI